MKGGACMVFISNSVCLLYVHMCIYVHKPVMLAEARGR